MVGGGIEGRKMARSRVIVESAVSRLESRPMLETADAVRDHRKTPLTWVGGHSFLEFGPISSQSGQPGHTASQGQALEYLVTLVPDIHSRRAVDYDGLQVRVLRQNRRTR